MNIDQQINRKNSFNFLLHIPVPWVFILTYLIGVGLHFLFPIYSFPQRAAGIIRIGGIILFVIGAVIAAWSLFIFHKHRTTTTPGETSIKLVTWGPYQFSRNPMYVSLIIAYIGEAAILLQIWPLVLLPLTIIYINRIVIPIEEFHLKETFGKMYEQYCLKVRRWI